MLAVFGFMQAKLLSGNKSFNIEGLKDFSQWKSMGALVALPDFKSGVWG